MSLPVLSKTWQFDVNRRISTTGAATSMNQKIARAIFTSLYGFAQNPWVCYYSCDSVVAGAAGDGVNRWAADANVVFNAGGTGTARSWMVAQNPVTGMQILFDCAGTSTVGGAGTNGYLFMSPAAGFTGGTTTARPTATDEINLVTPSGTRGGWCNVAFTNALTDVIAHTWHSSDGQITMMCWCNSNFSVSFWYLGQVTPTNQASWTNPVVGWVTDGLGTAVSGPLTANGITYPNTLLFASGNRVQTKIGTDTVTMWPTSEGYLGSVVGARQTTADDDSFEWPILPMGLASNTASHQGRKGRLIDLFAGSAGAFTGNTYPAPPDTPLEQFAQFGVFILPWNNTAVVIA